MLIQIIGLILIGLVLLFIGAEFLIRSSSSFGLKMGITPLIVGITIVGYGTSMPELIVILEAAINGQSDIALGNVIGSNIANIGLVLGCAALIKPVAIHTHLRNFDIPVMIFSGVLLYLFSFNATLYWWNGVILLSFVVIYSYLTICLVKKHKRLQKEVEGQIEIKPFSSSKTIDLLVAALSIITLIVGAKWFLDGSVGLARAFNISEAVIGLTLVAVGTSLPEMATSLVAAYRGHTDIAIGNVVGSNIYNILGVLGISALITPLLMSSILNRDYLFMIFLSLYLSYLSFLKHGISRLHGSILIGSYIVYITLLFKAT